MVNDNDFDGGDLFDRVDDLLEEVEKEIEQIMSSFRRNRDMLLNRPFVKGFTLDFQNGRPTFRTFGDLDIRRRDREPLVEQSVKDDHLVVIAEMPGVSKEDIHIEANEEEMSINAQTEDRVYKTTISLKEPIDPDSCNAKYINGILEVRAKLKGKVNKGYKGIPVE
jgi:HSP20 family protein